MGLFGGRDGDFILSALFKKKNNSIYWTRFIV